MIINLILFTTSLLNILLSATILEILKEWEKERKEVDKWTD